MRNKIVALFAATALAFGGLSALPANDFTVPKASAHISECTIAQKAPKKYGVLLRAEGAWWCEGLSAHHNFVASEIQIQVLIEQWGPDRWLGIPPSNKVKSKRAVGVNRATVNCMKGTHTYRAIEILDSYGAHGVKRKSKKSGEKTISC